MFRCGTGTGRWRRIDLLLEHRKCPGTNSFCAYLSHRKRFSSRISVHAVGSERRHATDWVTGTRRCDHITLVRRLLQQSCWLPLRQRVDFKVATLVHRSLSGNLPSYCRLIAYARERRLRSTESRVCIVTRTHNIFSDRALAAAGPGL